jgi:hypothetical protein
MKVLMRRGDHDFQASGIELLEERVRHLEGSWERRFGHPEIRQKVLLRAQVLAFMALP